MGAFGSARNLKILSIYPNPHKNIRFYENNQLIRIHLNLLHEPYDSVYERLEYLQTSHIDSLLNTRYPRAWKSSRQYFLPNHLTLFVWQPAGSTLPLTISIIAELVRMFLILINTWFRCARLTATKQSRWACLHSHIVKRAQDTTANAVECS